MEILTRTMKLNERKLKASQHFAAAIAQLGERQTEDLKVPGSIPGRGISLSLSHSQLTNVHPKLAVHWRFSKRLNVGIRKEANTVW